MLFSLEAYLLREWRTLTLVCHAPGFIAVVIVWFFLPETPR